MSETISRRSSRSNYNTSHQGTVIKSRSKRTSSESSENTAEESDHSDGDQPAAKVRYVGNNSLANRSRNSEVSNVSINQKLHTHHIDKSSPCSVSLSKLLLFFALLIAGIAALKVYRDDHTFNHGFYNVEEPLAIEHWNMTRSVFTSNVRKLKSLLPMQTNRTWMTILAAVKATLQAAPEYPAVLLLLAKDSAEQTAACLASKLTDITVEALSRPGESPPTERGAIITAASLASDDYLKAKELLVSELHNSLSSLGSVGILNLEHFHPQVAMSFHAFADNSNAPYKQACLVLNVADIGSSTSSPEERAEHILNHAWGSKLGQDKVYALISRLVVNVVEVEEEKVETLAKVCPTILAKAA